MYLAARDADNSPCTCILYSDRDGATELYRSQVTDTPYVLRKDMTIRNPIPN